MQAHIRCILPCLLVENGMHRPFAAIGHFACRNLFISGIILAISLSMSSLAPAAGRVSARSAENTDTRWLPWIGSWRLMPEVVKENDRSSKENYLVEIRSGDDGKSIIMKSFQDEKLLLETKIAADGSSQPLENNKCSGWYKYSWSDTGKRLLFESESGCPAELPRFISGISIITDNRDWLDIQLLQSGEDHAVSIRKYRSISENINTATKVGPSPTEAPRYLAGTSLSIDEVIELSRKVPSELLEAAILELQKPFKINSSTLKRLSSAGVQPQVVDLMVALSFPDKFTVNLQRIAPVRQTHSAPAGAFYSPSYIWLPFGFWSIYGPYSNWYWGTPVYGYWGSGWDSWPRGYSGGHGGRGDDGGGRLINGRGYSRVEPGNPNSQPRYAHPRDNSNSSSGGGNQGSTSPSSPPPATSSGSSSQSSTGRSGSSGGSPPSASPSGYHSGGGEGGGRQAKPRD